MTNENYERLQTYGQHGFLSTILYAAFIVALVSITYYFFFAIEFNQASLIPNSDSDWAGFFNAIKPTWEASVVFLFWFVLQVLLYYVVPGRKAEGVELETGGRLVYHINSMSAMWISFAVVALLHVTGIYTLDRLYHSFGALISVITIFSFTLSIWLYSYGKRHDPHHISGNFVRDFWMGTGLNPRLPATKTGFDFKFFCENRPGLIGWMVLNFSMVYVQYQNIGTVSVAMAIVVLMQLFYITNFFHEEEFLLTTMDIKHENFGLMLTYGDLVWVPFLYCLQAYYLIDHVHDLPLWAAALILLMNAFGFYIFNASNLQKDRFKRDPENTLIWGKKAEFLTTEAGGKLLISGFWGKARHLNYTGDLIQALAWSLPCLFGSAVPYFYPFYFAILLIHRDIRDNAMCKAKYKDDWDRYCQKVRWRLIPRIY